MLLKLRIGHILRDTTPKIGNRPVFSEILNISASRRQNRYIGCPDGSGMVVKSVRGRRRYIFFRTPIHIRRDDLGSILAEKYPDHKIITCHDGEAVVRCGPSDVPGIVEVLESQGSEYVSVKTSGTLRTLRDEYPSLRVQRKRRK